MCSHGESDGLLLSSHLMLMKAGYRKARRELFLMVLTRRFIWCNGRWVGYGQDSRLPWNWTEAHFTPEKTASR
jgi:hypothetical protein